MSGIFSFMDGNGDESARSPEKFIGDYLKREGWDTLYKLSMRRAKTEHLLEAAINNYDWRIEFTLDPDFEKEIQKVAAKEKLPTKRPEEKLVYHVAKHEKGHWRNCPADIDFLEAILDGTSAGLGGKGFSKQEVEEYSPYVANMFTDVVDNAFEALESGDRDFQEGQELFYLKEAYVTGDGPSLPHYYAIFVDCQMRLDQNSKRARTTAERFAKDYNSIKKDSKKALEILTGRQVAENAFAGPLGKADRELVLKALGDRGKWRRKARDFAGILAKYVKKDLVDVERRIKLMPILKKMRADGEFRREVIRRGAERGSGLLYADGFESYDEAYKSAASEIVLDFLKRDGEENPRFPLFYMKRQRLGDGDRLENVDWAGTTFAETGAGQSEAWLFRKEGSYEVDIEGISGTGSLEDVLFIVDTSGSMGWTRKPLDGSKYDMALRSIYSSINYLELTGKAAYLKYGLLMFGETGDTSWSGWKTYNELEGLKKDLFTKYQHAGETVLDPDKVEAALSEKSDNFLALMTSDGQIHNPDAARAACTRAIEDGNDFVLFQTMSKSDFAEHVAKLGAIVVNVDKPEDLVGLTLGKVDGKYSPTTSSSGMVYGEAKA